tara:strand:- start:93 stop:395 length:303 start_codon:yes stop_codon:yes gene_type:complete
MARKRNLGHVNVGHHNQALQKTINILTAQLQSILTSSVGVLGEFNIDSSGKNLITTDASIHISGSNTHLYINGTDANGDYASYYFDVVNGELQFKPSGSA